jgi:nitrogen fixation NifU-like protein
LTPTPADEQACNAGGAAADGGGAAADGAPAGECRQKVALRIVPRLADPEADGYGMGADATAPDASAGIPRRTGRHMRDEIYQTELLRLAARARAAGRLDAADRTARVDNPLCGDRVTVDLKLDPEGRIEAIGFEVKACMICQAAASVLGEHGPGHAAEEIAEVGREVAEMLKADHPPAPEEIEEFRAFLPVRSHKSRHRCVLLPFEAIARAFRDDPEAT